MTENDGILQLTEIGRWSKKTSDGSRSDLGLQPLPAVWDLVHSDSGNCLGRKCSDYEQCHYFKARKQLYGAHLLSRPEIMALHQVPTLPAPADAPMPVARVT